MSWRAGTFGDLLRQLRGDKGLTQEELAERAGMSVRGISDLERGRNRHPYRATLLRLIEVLEPSADEVQQLWALASRRRGPAAETTPEPRARLPHPLTVMLGREREQQNVLHRLRWEGARLVTLTGPGGVGKTRLAIDIAREAASDYADGVTFVSLAAVSDPALVPSAIVAALEMEVAAGSSPDQALRTALGDREHLLVLDNFEQIVEAGVFVADLLWACPKVKALITSRAPLRVRGEHQIPVEPLPLPLPDETRRHEDLLAAPATALFLERAREVNASLKLGPTEAHAIAAICRHLDGLPLAIELAAAQTRHSTPEDLLAQLQRSLEPLTSDFRDVPARQQTLHSTIDWSYRLLDPPEQTLFRRLSVFRGGGDLEAVAAVCGDDVALLRSLPVLHDSNLAVLRGDDGARTRVRMLEVVREYATQLLVEAGEGEALRRRHASYFAELVERVGPELTGGEQLRWLNRLRADLGNIRAAADWAQGSSELELGLRLVAPIWGFWTMTGQTVEGRQRLMSLLDADQEPSAADAVRARALYAAGALAFQSYEPAEARDLFLRALELCRALGDTRGIAECANGVGAASKDLGDYDESARWLEESIDLRTQRGDVPSTHAPLVNLANIVRYQGDCARALELYERALALQQQMGNLEAALNTMENMAQVLGTQGEYARAASLAAEAMELARENGLLAILAHILSNSGARCLERGDLAEAERLLMECQELCRRTGDRANADLVTFSLAELALQRDDLLQATALAQQALVRAREAGSLRREAYALLALGEAARMQGRLDLAAERLEACAALRRELKEPLAMVDVLEARARLAVSRGQPADAVRLYSSAAALRTHLGAPLPPVWHVRNRQDLDSLRGALGEDTFSAVWEQGEAQADSHLHGFAGGKLVGPR